MKNEFQSFVQVVKETDESKTKTDDEWIHSTCFMCVNSCGILAHRVNGVVVKIEGDPDNPHNFGKVCAKGNAGFTSLYDPRRVLTPMKRTNPKKGINEDPKWVPITWEEALSTVADKLEKVKRSDPRKLLLTTFDSHTFDDVKVWTSAFGTPNVTPWSADFYCGNGLHPVLYLTQGVFYAEPDFDYNKYCIFFGSQWGVVIQSNPMHMARKMSEAKERGMKLVVVDPVCSYAASVADTWLPIRPGTDAALALSIAHVLVNELGIYDAKFLKERTNAPYLVGPDGLYVRDSETQKPLVWDPLERKEKPVSSAPKESALTGMFRINDVECRPAFEVLKEHLLKYTPEAMSEITTLSAEKIREIAGEFGKAASIGSTVTIDGRELPLRPACATWHRGPSGHKHGFLNGLSIELLNLLVGAVDVPGGLSGNNPVGPWWGPKADNDGLLVAADQLAICHRSYPARKVRTPETLQLLELFPIASYSAAMVPINLLEDQRVIDLPYEPEVLIHCRNNPVYTSADPEKVARVFAKIPFQVSFVTELNETAEFADILLPEAHYLEKLDLVPINHPAEYLPAGEGYWFWQMTIPVVRSSSARDWLEVLHELAHRAGFSEDLYEMMNILYNLKDPYKLDPKSNYTWEEIADRKAKSMFGEPHGLEWFKKHSFIVTSRKKVEEAYPVSFYDKIRVPIYYEYLKTAGEDVRKGTSEMGIADWDVSDYQPLPDWKPCPSYNSKKEFDLFVVNTKTPIHNLSSYTLQNPMLGTLSEHQSWHGKVLINPVAAGKKGIKEGDRISIVSELGGKTTGEAHITELVHPDVIAIIGGFGHWSREMDSATKRGPTWNKLIPLELGRVDSLSGAVDSCVRVKVTKED